MYNRKLNHLRQSRKAIESGLDYILGKQHQQGEFQDFRSTGSASQEWITAHVCWVLEDIPEFKDASQRSARYLALRRDSNGMWGFNSTTVGDFSSTAQALMVLNRQKIKLSSPHVLQFDGAVCPEGGFRTYQISKVAPFNRWSLSHDDTSLEVIEALRRLKVGGDYRKEAIRWIRRKLKEGPLKSFWWKQPAYMLWLQKKVGINLGPSIKMSRFLIDRPAVTVPDLPLLLYKAQTLRRDPLLKDAVFQLLERQDSDGSWPCKPCLKVPSFRSTLKPSAAVDRLYPGEERIFSTAHAVAALHWTLGRA